MNTAELTISMARYGAETSGISDCFTGDAELDRSCFPGMLKEENLGVSERADGTGDSHKAFFAAHAIKGLAGSFGTTPFYQASR